MLAIIRKRIHLRIAVLALLAAGALGFTSCASNKETALITDPNYKKETALPWNEQTKWEREGQGAELNQQRR